MRDWRSEAARFIEALPIDLAHTYASENAEDYRRFDAGQRSYKAKLLRALRADERTECIKRQLQRRQGTNR